MQLPKELEGYSHGIAEALRKPDLATWGKGDRFHHAEVPEHIAGVLISAVHRELSSATFAFLFKEHHSEPGTAARSAAQLHYLSGRDFILTFDWTVWRGLEPLERVALVDHLLEHCTTDDNENWDIREYDVREFGRIVARWGFWNTHIRRFSLAVARAKAQTDLFASQEETPLTPEQVEALEQASARMRGEVGNMELAERVAQDLEAAGVPVERVSQEPWYGVPLIEVGHK